MASDILDLDWEFIDHLAIPESVNVIQQEQVSPHVIQTPKAREIYEYQLGYFAKHRRPATKSVLEDEFNRGDFEIKFTQPETVIEDLIERLRARYVRNQGNRILKRLAKTAVNDPLSVAHEMNEEARKLSDLVTRRGKAISSGQHSVSVNAYNRRLSRGVQGSLGFDELDTHFFGLEGVNFFIAPPKGYKSWLMVNCLLKNLIDGKRGDLYSLELPAEDTDWRLKCLAANIPYWKYLRGKLSPEDLKKIQEASEYLDALGSYRISKPPLGQRTVDHLVNNARDLGADLILVDQLQYIETSKGNTLGGKNDTGEYWDAINRFVDASDSGPIVIAHQYNRSIQGAEEMPLMQQIKGSSAIEEGATLALGLWSNKEMRASNIFEIGTLASRHYSHKSWEVRVKLSSECNFSIIGET